MGYNIAAALGRLNGILQSLKVKNLTVTGTETILGSVAFAGATQIGSSAADTLTIGASWPAFSVGSIPFFAADKTLTQDASLTYTPATKTLASIVHLAIPTATGSLPAAASGAIVYDSTAGLFKFGVAGAYVMAVFAGTPNTFTAAQTITVPTTTGLIANLATAPVGSASAFMGAISIPSGTVGFITAAQTGDYSTLFLGQATLTGASAGTIQNAATVKINGSPIQGANVTVTNNHSLWVASGTTRLDSKLCVNGGTSTGARVTINHGTGGDTGSASAYRGFLYGPAATNTFVTTPQTGDYSAVEFGIITLVNPSAGTIPNAATLKLAGAPAAGASVTLTNPYALWVAAGKSRFDGAILVRTTSASNNESLSLMANTAGTGGGSADFGVLNAKAGTISYTGAQTGDYSSAFLGVQSIASDTPGTIAAATTLRIAGAPAPSGGNVTITAARALWVVAGLTQLDGGLTVTGGSFTLSDQNVVLGTGAGTQWGTAVGQKQGWWGATAIARLGAYTLTYTGLSRVLAADTAADVVTTAAALASYGYTQAQANAIPVAINAIRVDLDNVKNVVAQAIADDKLYGLKG